MTADDYILDLGGLTMNKKTNLFLMGFVNAFQPLNYTKTKDICQVSKQINDKINYNRGQTLVKINKISTKGR